MFWELMILWPQYQKSQKCSGYHEHFYKTQNPQLFEQTETLEGIFLSTLFKKMRTKARFFYKNWPYKISNTFLTHFSDKRCQIVLFPLGLTDLTRGFFV